MLVGSSVAPEANRKALEHCGHIQPSLHVSVSIDIRFLISHKATMKYTER